MLEIMLSGGPLMWLILLCSMVSMAIVVERFWSLRSQYVMPKDLLATVWHCQQSNQFTEKKMEELKSSSPLGRIFAAVLISWERRRDETKEMIEDVGRHVAHDLARFLNTLGTVATISPLLGLLGTVMGMIQVFAVITSRGVGDPGVLAGGISQALLTTAFGLSVAIPSLLFYRHFRGKIDALVIAMEQESLRLLEMLYQKNLTASPSPRKSFKTPKEK